MATQRQASAREGPDEMAKGRTSRIALQRSRIGEGKGRIVAETDALFQVTESRL